MYLLKLFVILSVIIGSPLYFFVFKEEAPKVVIEDKANKIADYFKNIVKQQALYIDRGFKFTSLEDLYDKGFLDEEEKLYLGKVQYDAERKLIYITKQISHDEYDHEGLDKKACIEINEVYYPTIKCIRGSIGNIDFERLKLVQTGQAVLEAGLTKEGMKTSIFMTMDHKPKSKSEKDKKKEGKDTEAKESEAKKKSEDDSLKIEKKGKE